MAEASSRSETASPYAANKARYEALYSGAKAKRRDFSEAKGNPATLDPGLITFRETVPAGWGWSGLVRRGDTMRVINTGGTAGVSLLLYNAADPTERFNAGDTVKIQWTARLSRGRVLFSDMGRVLASITDDSFGFNDALAGGSTAQTNKEKYGDEALRNTRDNFILLAAKHGLGKRDVPPCLTLFAPVGVDASGHLAWQDKGAADGDYVDLRAELDLLVFVSNAPHPLAPGDYAPKDIEIVTWSSPPPERDDFCRTATEEAQRGFDNNEYYLAQGRNA
ncbi:conserved hypothetical protein [Parvibaculum lavamentivorans DS-1]|uniref:DUF1989 domain-containing protein n=1 Tax=Parvibaculum lavamentivorans (strain DS-1 / DSM 13023 / NCIMB 13966) TaxID=402881 RepID=A7HUC2_PARL1|nr:urea amidolyase associated protein UAAP1 [Parvibaculum lavamentivorans]ABS63505.1 conserved hypothetical protein [Parvibaculum lavamentivorans DS-1]